MPILTFRFNALALALCVSTGSVHAQSWPRQQTVRHFTWENDSHYLTDRFYTSGVQLSTKSTADRRGDFARALTHRLCSWAGCDATTAVASQINVGQMIFTPRDITVAAAQPEDRPWAGLLYYERMFSFLSSDQKTMTLMNGQLGATGNLSLAEHAQKAFHDLLDRPRPMGWHNQVGASLGLMLSLEKRSAVDTLSFDLPADVEFKTAAYWRVAAGTIQTYAAGGLAIMIGKNLPLVSAPPPGIGNTAAQKRAARAATCLFNWLQCTGFASIEGRLLAYNVFLDGRPFSGDPNINKRTFVYDIVVGNRFDFPRTRTATRGPWFLQLKATQRSREFHSVLPVPTHRVYGVTVGSEF